jgi:hypothetical protein
MKEGEAGRDVRSGTMDPDLIIVEFESIFNFSEGTKGRFQAADLPKSFGR